MPACVASVRLQKIRRIVENPLVFRPHDSGLHSGRMIRFVQIEKLIHVRAHRERDPTLGTPEPHGHRRPSSHHIDGDSLVITVDHDLPDIFHVPGMNHQVGDFFHDALSQFQGFFHGLAGSVFDPGEVVVLNVVFADDILEHADLLFREPGGNVTTNRLIPFALLLLEISVGQAQLLFEQGVETAVRMLELVRGPPLEYVTIGSAFRSRLSPVRGKTSLLTHFIPSRFQGLRLRHDSRTLYNRSKGHRGSHCRLHRSLQR